MPIPDRSPDLDPYLDPDPATMPPALRQAVSLVRDAAAPMWLAWGEGLTVVSNAACDEAVGPPPHTALAPAWLAIWPDLAAMVASALRGQGARRDTYACTPLRDEQDAVCGVLFTFQDIAGQHGETAERYRLARLATNDAIWDWRMADGHVIWNQALYTLFGHRDEATSAEWWLAHIHPDDRGHISHTIHEVIDGAGVSWTGEYRFLRADGGYADILDRGTVLRDADGRPLRMIGAMLDLTERKAQERALRESELLFRTLFESIDEGFCVIEFLDGPHGPLSDFVHVMANPAYTTNAGIPDVVGQRMREMVPLEAEGWIEIYRRVLLSGEPLRFERELERTGRHLELAALRIEPPERRQVAVLFQDITLRHKARVAMHDMNDTLERRVQVEVAQRARTEDALRQAQKMEAVGQLTGGIAHDFNNMLAVVSNALELLDRRFTSGDERARHFVGMAKGGVRRAAQLTQRLLAFSRQQSLAPQAVDVNRLVAGMSEMLTHSLGAAIAIDTVLAPDLWPTHVDPNQLEHALLNLAVNARDAMEGGGRLTIASANRHLAPLDASAHAGIAAGDYVTIAVTDTGAGMSEEIVARAFDPFFTTKEVGRGTGLGLSQVYGFVRQSGGHVRIDSVPGRGTTVHIWLQRHAGPGDDARPALPATAMPCGDGSETVLVVEDENAVRVLLVGMLDELGYRVLAADGGTGALQLLDAHPEVALMITDVVMPGMNGRELADTAARRRPGLPVLFTTGYSRNVMVGDGVLARDVQVIGKPFSLEELALRVRAILDAAPGRSLN